VITKHTTLKASRVTTPIKKQMSKEEHLRFHQLENNDHLKDGFTTEPAVGLSRDTVNGLRAIHRFVERLLEMELDYASPANEVIQLSNRKRLGAIPTGGFLDSFFRQQYQTSPQVQIFLEAEDTLRLREHARLSEQARKVWLRRHPLPAELTNSLIDLILHKAVSKNFRRQVAKRKFAVHENFQRGETLINKLFDRHNRLNVIRIDLGYRREHSPSLEQVKVDLARLLNNYRHNSNFDSILGWVWRLEWAPQTGYHLHLLFFLHGSKTLRDSFAARTLGAYWENNITDGRGRHHNCNLEKSKYPRLGIGLISHLDGEKRGVLVHDVLSYLAKVDVLVRPRWPSGTRTFNTSQYPEPHPGTGRRRRSA
jgi:hypothetical protein